MESVEEKGMRLLTPSLISFPDSFVCEKSLGMRLGEENGKSLGMRGGGGEWKQR